MNTPTTNEASAPGSGLLGPLIERLRGIKDRKDEAAAILKAIGAEEAECEAAILNGLRDSGQDKATVKGVGTASVKEKMRTVIEPDKWAGIYKWCVETGNTHILHRAMTATKVEELIENGVVLPPGISMQPYTDLGFRRS